VARANFQISPDAKAALLDALRTFKARFGKDVVPAIMLVDPALNPGLPPEITIGFYDDRTEIEGAIQKIGDLDVVLAVSDQDLALFEGKTLDYEDDRFVTK
jgi:hypothetical protein